MTVYFLPVPLFPVFIYSPKFDFEGVSIIFPFSFQIVRSLLFTWNLTKNPGHRWYLQHFTCFAVVNKGIWRSLASGGFQPYYHLGPLIRRKKISCEHITKNVSIIAVRCQGIFKSFDWYGLLVPLLRVDNCSHHPKVFELQVWLFSSWKCNVIISKTNMKSFYKIVAGQDERSTFYNNRYVGQLPHLILIFCFVHCNWDNLPKFAWNEVVREHFCLVFAESSWTITSPISPQFSPNTWSNLTQRSLIASSTTHHLIPPNKALTISLPRSLNSKGLSKRRGEALLGDKVRPLEFTTKNFCSRLGKSSSYLFFRLAKVGIRAFFFSSPMHPGEIRDLLRGNVECRILRQIHTVLGNSMGFRELVYIYRVWDLHELKGVYSHSSIVSNINTKSSGCLKCHHGLVPILREL